MCVCVHVFPRQTKTMLPASATYGMRLCECSYKQGGRRQETAARVQAKWHAAATPHVGVAYAAAAQRYHTSSTQQGHAQPQQCYVRHCWQEAVRQQCMCGARTSAMPDSTSTDAACTPGVPRSAASTALLQLAQVMPPTFSSCVLVWAGRTTAGGQGQARRGKGRGLVGASHIQATGGLTGRASAAPHIAGGSLEPSCRCPLQNGCYKQSF